MGIAGISCEKFTASTSRSRISNGCSGGAMDDPRVNVFAGHWNGGATHEPLRWPISPPMQPVARIPLLLLLFLYLC
jgi:hypothetical protein